MPEHTTHLTAETLCAYLSGELDAQAVAAAELHVEACAACAELLFEEARFEEALHQAAVLAEKRPSRARFGSVFRSSIAAFASAAAMLLVLLPGQPDFDVPSDASERMSVGQSDERRGAQTTLDADYLSCIPPSDGEVEPCDDGDSQAILASTQPVLASWMPPEELATWPDTVDAQRLCTPADPRDDTLCRPIEEF